MRFFSTPIFVLTTLLVGCGPKVVTDPRKAQAVKSIECGGNVELTVRMGVPKLEIQAEESMMSHIKSEFVNGRLRVWTEGNFNTNAAIQAHYWTPSLTEIETRDSAKVDAREIAGAEVRVLLLGASQMVLEGTATKLRLETGDVARADLRHLRANDAIVKAGGSSHVQLWAERSLQADASGTSEIVYRKPVSGEVRATARESSSIKGE